MINENVRRDLKSCAKRLNRALHDIEKATSGQMSNGLTEVTERLGDGGLSAVLKKLDIQISGF